MIVADTGAIIALMDADDRHHAQLSELFDDDPTVWVLPWAILPEVAYLAGKYLGAASEASFVRDVAEGQLTVEWAEPGDLDRAHTLMQRHAALNIGLVDAVVMATAERLRAKAIATLDLRDFGAVKLRGTPKLFPRDV